MSGRSLCFNLIITPKPLIRGVPLRARVFISDLSIIYCQPSSVKMLILTRSGDRGGPGGRGIMYAISLWLIASLRIFSGRPVLTDSACDDEASDDEMEYMIFPRHILYHILKFLCMTQTFSGLLNRKRVYITTSIAFIKPNVWAPIQNWVWYQGCAPLSMTMVRWWYFNIGSDMTVSLWDCPIIVNLHKSLHWISPWIFLLHSKLSSKPPPSPVYQATCHDASQTINICIL